ncbi:MAG: hypothetical protein GY715_05780 [Planctomycetes bacterium]|nr:hypothetical protein [Planctomycetota bacterium]
MTEIELRALDVLKRRGALSATELGASLWEPTAGVPTPQRYARTAGLILHGLERRGFVEPRRVLRVRVWKLSERGREILAAAGRIE